MADQVADAVPSDLPALGALADLSGALETTGTSVLVAPPGTGKTTALPPALAEQPWLRGRILLVVPRRMAARAAAARMASQHGTGLGDRFGYSVRGDSRSGPRTVVEAVTPGLLLRRLQADPSLEGVGAVLLDEFHERSVDLDLLLALLCDVRGALRPDEMPASMPSSLASRRAVTPASSFLTRITSSIRSARSTSGTNPAPMPWILCGPGLPPERTGEPSGSTATGAMTT